ncbi:hypothetical protein [Psychromonas hadalis]|uniref:hypothetical protein n=1 Tax=Psychromonas hadalis TaxID=211669 RepID=UPI0003B7726F|nr:hypothetical protein [Psychromonas hadalis]
MDYISYVFTAVLACLAGFLATYAKEKAKNYAIKEDFILLTKQLGTNTEIVENIKKTLSEKSWINQQVWLKKQAIYEEVFEKLLLIKKHAYHQSKEFHYHLYLEREHEYYLSHDGDTWPNDPNLKRDLERKKNEFNERVTSSEYKEEVEGINKGHEEAVAWLMESASINSVYIDERVQNSIEKINIISNRSKVDWGDFDEVEDHIYGVKNAVDNAIKEIKEICRDELKIET